MEKLFRIQKKAIRIVNNSPWNAHSLPLFKRLNLLTVQDINKLQTLCFTYSALHHLIPDTFTQYFQRNSQIHSHNTRASASLHVQSHTTTLREYTARIHAPHIWNTLSVELQTLPTLSLFKCKLKKFLLLSYV